MERGGAGRSPGRVEGVAGIERRVVLAPGRTGVIVPAADFALEAARDLKVDGAIAPLGVHAIGVESIGVASQGVDIVGPIVTRDLGGFHVAGGGKGIERQVILDRQFEVVAGVGDLFPAQPVTGVPAVAIDGLVATVGETGQRIEVAGGTAGTVEGFLGLAVQRQVGEAVVGQRQAVVDRLVHGVAIAAAVAAERGLGAAAAVVFLEDDVDHPGDGVRTILRGGTVAQHLDVIDRRHGNQVEVDRHRRRADPRQVVDQRRVVSPFAVDQHQYLIAGQAAHGHPAHRPGSAAAIDRRQVEGGQQAREQFLEADLAAGLQLFGADHIDRRGAVGDGAWLAAAVAGDHHRAQGFVRFSVLCMSLDAGGQQAEGGGRVVIVLHSGAV